MKRNANLSIVVVILLVALISGCNFSPGSNTALATPSEVQHPTEVSPAEATAAVEKLTAEPIEIPYPTIGEVINPAQMGPHIYSYSTNAAYPIVVTFYRDYLENKEITVNELESGENSTTFQYLDGEIKTNLSITYQAETGIVNVLIIME